MYPPPRYPINRPIQRTQSINRSSNLQDQRRRDNKTHTPSRLLPRVRSQIHRHTQIQIHTLLFPAVVVYPYATCALAAIPDVAPTWYLYIPRVSGVT